MTPEIYRTSMANLCFVVKYKAQRATPDGQLEFQYCQIAFNIHSKGDGVYMRWGIYEMKGKLIRFNPRAVVNLVLIICLLASTAVTFLTVTIRLQ